MMTVVLLLEKYFQLARQRLKWSSNKRPSQTNVREPISEMRVIRRGHDDAGDQSQGHTKSCIERSFLQLVARLDYNGQVESTNNE